MKNVLILAIEFAPYNTPGAFRTIYFSKYLVKHGYRPIVLTVEPPTENKLFEARRDDNLSKLLSEETIVHYLPLEDYSYAKNWAVAKLQMYFKTQDRFTKFWKRSVEEFLPKAMVEFKPELVYTTCPFFSLANFSVDISNRYKIPLVLDMRDNWSQWVISPYASFFHYLAALKREKRAFLEAAHILTVTPELKNIFLAVNKSIKEDKITVIPNGYDFDLDFEKAIKFDGLENSKDKIVISYVGSYYYDPKMHRDMYTPWHQKKWHKMLQYSPVKENWLYRSPYFFFRSLQALFKLSPGLKSKIEFHQIGKCPKWLGEMVKEFDLSANFVDVGFIPKNELVEKLEASDFFLGTSVKVEGGLDYALASKTFDYLSAHKPILSFTVDGAQSNFTKNSNCGVLFNPDKPDENALKLKEIFENGICLQLNREYTQQFSRKMTANKLAEVFNQVIGKTNKQDALHK